ncbi:MAG: hydrogenase maturation protease [Candidatus Eisenbacteria bacterium]|nr:hydrogenase maturation protease [Candidatus Eisenbacteria bacterium]
MLVLGFGVPLRRDDGVGIAALEGLRALGFGRDGEDLVRGDLRGNELFDLLERHERALVLDSILEGDGPAGGLIEAGLREARFLLRPHGALRGLDFGTAFELARKLDLRLPEVEFLLMRVRDTAPGEGFSAPVARALPRMIDAAARMIRVHTGAT